MKTDKFAGAIGAVVTMVFHPTGGGAENIARMAHLAIGVHALAIASVGLQACGYLRFTRQIRSRQPIADVGMVAFAIGATTGILAATVSGILSPAMADYTLEADAAERAVWDVVFAYNFLLNGALANVFIAATSIALLAWSVGMLSAAPRMPLLGGAGVVIAGGSLFVLLTGHLGHNVHDVGMFVFATAGWAIALGIVLCRDNGDRGAAQS